MDKLEPTKHLVSFNTMCRLCSAVLDTGFVGSTEDYFREVDGRDLNLITEVEAAELIIKLEANKGSLFPGVVIQEDKAGQFSFKL